MRRGFTMLEVLLAMVVLSMVSMILWTTFNNSFRLRDKLDTREQQTHALRSLFQRMSRDLQMAFIIRDKKFHTVFIGKDEGSADSLTFASFSGRISSPGEILKTDQQVVFYYVKNNPIDGSLFDVYRDTYPYIEDDQYWGERRGTKIASRLRRFDLSYYDGQDYKETWDSTRLEFSGKLPLAVKLSLQLDNEQVIKDYFSIALPVALANKAMQGPAAPATPPPAGGTATTPNSATTPPKPNTGLPTTTAPESGGVSGE